MFLPLVSRAIRFGRPSLSWSRSVMWSSPPVQRCCAKRTGFLGARVEEGAKLQLDESGCAFQLKAALSRFLKIELREPYAQRRRSQMGLSIRARPGSGRRRHRCKPGPEFSRLARAPRVAVCLGGIQSFTDLSGPSSKWVASDILGGKRTIWLDLGDDFVSRAALMDSYETLETGVVSALSQKGDVFLDIGANIGWYTLLASTLVGRAGHIHAFEPREPTLGYLRRTIAMNRLQSMVTVHDFGLGDVGGEFLLGWAHGSRNPGSAHLVGAESPQIEADKIQIKTLDALNMPKIDFIRLDVEGAEPRVIVGGRKAIETRCPIILAHIANSVER